MEQPNPAPSETALALLDAAEVCLQRHGLAGLSTRRVAEEAGVPLSQIHYHFGSKRQLLLALLEHQNRKLLARQATMYAQPMPLWKRWEQACDYLEEDLRSGYVRVLQEMIAAGWSDPRIAAEARRIVGAWYALLTRVATEAGDRLGGLGPFTPAEAGTLAGHLFMAAEVTILLGFGEDAMPIRSALHKIGELLRQLETSHDRGNHHASEESGP